MAFTSETLRVFLAVIDEGSFSAAARVLGRVPSAVNMAISQLEAELDLVLFDRATRKALPTPAARALEPQARQVASQLNLLDAHALQLHAGLERRFVLVMAPELQTGAWSRPLVTLAEEFPALEIEIRSAARAEAIRLLHEGSVDLALIFERPGI
ncbi:LysR family transcriptional regulator, partial [Pseudomonas sp. BAV 2493]